MRNKISTSVVGSDIGKPTEAWKNGSGIGAPKTLRKCPDAAEWTMAPLGWGQLRGQRTADRRSGHTASPRGLLAGLCKVACDERGMREQGRARYGDDCALPRLITTTRSSPIATTEDPFPTLET